MEICKIYCNVTDTSHTKCGLIQYLGGMNIILFNNIYFSFFFNYCYLCVLFVVPFVLGYKPSVSGSVNFIYEITHSVLVPPSYAFAKPAPISNVFTHVSVVGCADKYILANTRPYLSRPCNSKVTS